MPFKKMEIPKYPPRLWALVGFPGSGKSTFALRMRGPLLPIDADQRFEEVLPLAECDVYALSAVPADHTDPQRIAALLDENMPGTRLGTIIVDSLTAIIAPKVTRAMLERDTAKNKVAIFVDKALAMRRLQDAVSKWGTDVLWIYHLQRGRDNNAQQVTTSTIPKTERARLMRSLNLQLQVEQKEDGQRGIKVTWARRGRSFPELPVLWDETGTWEGMPERIEAAVYDGLTYQEQQAIAQQAPAHFADDAAAITWGLEQGAFQALQHARNAHTKLQREHPGLSRDDLAALWVDDVDARLTALTPEQIAKNLAAIAAETSEAAPEESVAAPEESVAVPEESVAVPEELGIPPQQDPLDAFFPRDEETAAPPEPSETAPSASTTKKVETANDFWYEFYAFKNQGRLLQAEQLKDAPQIIQARETGEWNTAYKWLLTQVGR